MKDVEKVESFTLDHTKVVAPYVRKCKRLVTEHGDIISKFDLRFTQPNKKFMDSRGMHTLEHLLAVEFVTAPWVSIDVSCMACKTGVYWSVIGDPSEDAVAKYLLDAIPHILLTYHAKSEVPGATKEQCGNYKFHNMKKALTYLFHFALHLEQGHY